MTTSSFIMREVTRGHRRYSSTSSFFLSKTTTTTTTSTSTINFNNNTAILPPSPSPSLSPSSSCDESTASLKYRRRRRHLSLSAPFTAPSHNLTHPSRITKRPTTNTTATTIFKKDAALALQLEEWRKGNQKEMPVPTTTTTTTTTSTTTTTTGVSTPPTSPSSSTTSNKPISSHPPLPASLTTHQTVDIAIRILFAILAPTTTSNTTTPATQPPTRLDIISTTTLAHAAVLNLPFCTSTSGPSHPLLHALLLIHRITRNPLPASLQSPTHLLLAALILSEAQLSDRQTSTVVWSRLLEMAVRHADGKGGLASKEIAALKRDALEALQFSTGVSVPEYSAWLASLKLFLHQSFGVGGNNGQWKA